jgi:hypothetical protein
MAAMETAECFDVIDRLMHADQIPSWTALVSVLDIPDDRWRRHDPHKIEADEVASWQLVLASRDAPGVVWLGIAEFGDHTAIDPIGYAELDSVDFTKGLLWRAALIPSRDLTAFTNYARDPSLYDAYSYAVSLAWLGMCVRLHLAAVNVQAGFSDGDFLTF